MVKKYTDLNYKVGKHFKVKEFQSKDGHPVVLIDDVLVTMLDQIRDYFGKEVIINSGYRTVSHNAAVGGVANSQHTLGKAADIVVKGVLPAAVQSYAYDHLNGTVGTYTTFTHIDTRTTVKLFRGNCDFRRDNYELYKVEEITEEKPMDEKRYQTLEEIPEYAKECIEDLTKAGIIKGTGEGYNFTEDMLRVIVIAYRMAVSNGNVIYQLMEQMNKGGETK